MEGQFMTQFQDNLNFSFEANKFRYFLMLIYVFFLNFPDFLLQIQLCKKMIPQETNFSRVFENIFSASNGINWWTTSFGGMNNIIVQRLC